MTRYIHFFLTSALLLLTLSNISYADTANDEIRITVDNVWLIMSAALVFFMQSGFAFLEAGMTRAKNSINVLMKNYTDVCFGSIGYWLIGFGLMFGVNQSGIIGTDHFMMNDAGNLDYSILLYQTMFAATAATIVSGSVAERTRYWPYLVSSILITSFVYPISGSWVWGSLYEGQGWLAKMGFIDFAGSSVVHSVGGWSALAAIIIIGPRLGKFDENKKARNIRGHNLTMVAIGGFILWVGWFGFNGGSAAASQGLLGQVLINTHLSASAGVVGGILFMLLTKRPLLLSNSVNCSLGGLVAITAGCATMSPMYAIITGLIAGIVVVLGLELLEDFGLDDVVGAIPVHAFCGAWGTLAAGLFIQGNIFDLQQTVIQLIGIVSIFLWTFLISLIIYSLINIIFGLRADTTNELKGLDYTEHYEIGYPEFQETTLQE